MHPAVELVAGKAHVEAEPAVKVSGIHRALEPHAHVIIDLLFAVDDGRAHAAVAHDVHGGVHEIGVRALHHDTEVVNPGPGSRPVLHHVLGPGVRPAGGERRHRGAAIGRLCVKLHDLRGGLPRDGGLVAAVAGRRHRDAREGSLVHRIKEVHGGHSLGIGGPDGYRDGLAVVRHGRRVQEVREGRPDVAFGAGVRRRRGPHVERPAEVGVRRDPVHPEARVQLVGARDPLGAEGDFVERRTGAPVKPVTITRIAACTKLEAWLYVEPGLIR